MPTSSNPRLNSQRNMWLALGGVLMAACLCLALGVGGGVAVYLNHSQPTASAEGASVMYVLDASPRMALPGESGTPRLTVARGVLAEIVRPADPAVLSGLRVFGTGAVKQACQDTHLLVPLGPSSQKLISDKVSTLEAGQSTDSALAQAIVAAIRDLATKQGPHALVVVTGGADSCNPNAAQVVAQEAKHAGIDLETYVVGFGVSATEAQAIKVVVDQTPQGHYVDATDEAKLRATLKGLRDRIEHPASTYAAQSACDYPYNPMRLGATWEYALAGALYSETVKAVTGGMPQANVTVAYDSGDSRGTYGMTCGPNGIEDFQQQFGALGQGASVQMTMTSHSGWTLVPPDQLAPGVSWQSTVEWRMRQEANGQAFNMTYQMADAYTAVGVESVTTPAGTFEAIRVDNHSTTRISGLPQITGANGITETTSSLTSWYARGVGLVKMTVNGDRPMVVEELIAYSVPGTPNAARAAFTPPAPMALPTDTITPVPSTGSLLGDFPLYPGATLDPTGTFDEKNHGQFRFQSGDTLNQVNQFYDQELPSRGWTLSYVMPTTSGGPVQRWSKDNLRLELRYQPADEGTTPATVCLGMYDRLDLARARAFLPPDFPLPENTEFVGASDTQVDLFVRQDYPTVVAFYTRQRAALAQLGWTEGEATPMQGSCGGGPGCTSSQANWPAGTTPMPWPTADPRGSTALSWIAPDKDEFLIEIFAYQQATRLSVGITLKSPEHAQLPADVPIYQGAEIQFVSPGTISFQAPASLDAVTQFYDGALAGAGWQVQPIQVPTMKTWKKDAVEISVVIMEAGPQQSNVMISCVNCTPP
jgi:hypothetical protein